MRNIFDLTKREQRLVILIVVTLVAFAFAKHLLEKKVNPLPATSTSMPTPSPRIHSKEEESKSDDSR